MVAWCHSGKGGSTISVLSSKCHFEMEEIPPQLHQSPPQRLHGGNIIYYDDNICARRCANFKRCCRVGILGGRSYDPNHRHITQKYYTLQSLSFLEGIVSYRNGNTGARRCAYFKQCCRVGAVGGRQWEMEFWNTSCRSEYWWYKGYYSVIPIQRPHKCPPSMDNIQ